MHEISICQSIVDTLKVELKEEQYENVREVYLKVGKLSCVDPSILDHMFKYVTEETLFQKSVLHTELVDVLAACEQCNTKFKVEDYCFICPSCGNPSPTVIEGNELTIYKIILEEPAYAETNQ